MIRLIRRFRIPVLVLALLCICSWCAWAQVKYYPSGKIGAGGFVITGGKFLLESSVGTDRVTIAANTGTMALVPSHTTTYGLSITGAAQTTGDLFKLQIADGTNTTGLYFKCTDGTNTDFSVGEGGDVTVGGTLTTTGAATLNGGLAMDTNKFTVADGSGNTTIAGTLKVTDNTSLGVLAAYKGNISTQTGAAVAVTAADTGKMFVAAEEGGDAATTFTLDDPSAATVGCVFYFMQTSNQDLHIVPTTANGNSIVADNVATSDKISLSTANHKVGAVAMVVGISATKWLATSLTPTCPLTVEAAD